MSYFFLTLAADDDWIRLVVSAISVVIVFGGWIASQLASIKRQGNKKEEDQERGPATPARARAAEVPNADALARRRQEQLERMIRGQRGATAARQEPGPGNLTVNESLQRQKAQEIYRQRAEKLRREQQAAEEQLRQKEIQQRAAAPRARGQAGRGPAPVTGARPTTPTRRISVPTAPRQPIAHVPATHGAQGASHSVLTEMPATPATMRSAITKPATEGLAYAQAGRRPRLAADALRQAVILKEILDTPVGLRLL
ncbi:MAG: hypothetical protein IT443_09760 [Phycisphaeraceae bacterium]|nr:hypothetical protein [Phycisphaeraceae bacterium]